MSNDEKFHLLARIFFEVLDYKVPPPEEIDGGSNLLFRAFYRKHFHDGPEPWSLQGALDKVIAEGGTHDDMRSSIAANYLFLAVQCANNELSRLELEEFEYPGNFCTLALEQFGKMCGPRQPGAGLHNAPTKDD